MSFKKLVVLLICLFGFISISNAQHFQVTDVKLSEKLSLRERQKVLKETLGADLALYFYDTHLKIVVNGDDKDALIFNKIKEDKYEYSNSGGYSTVLLLNKFIGYIKSINFYSYKNGDWLQTISAKRK